MDVVNQKETQASLGDVAEAGIHFPDPPDALSKDSHEGPQHNNDDHQDYGHGIELAEVLRVVFVALAAAAVWFHLWEPFHRVSIIGLVATLIGGLPHFQGGV